MNFRVVATLLLLLSLLPAVGCDKASPVAPDGSILTISANPSQVALNGRSTITVVGRKPDGNPLNPGTEIRLTAARGTIDSIVTTDSQGRATATFRADGRAGEVEISAATGSGDAAAETTIQVGIPDTDRPDVQVSVTPSTLAVGADAEVTVVARNADGSLVPQGTSVILTTTLGSISPSRTTIGRDGTARATLTAGQREGTATVTAVVGASEPETATVEIILDLATGITVSAQPSSIPAATGAPASDPIVVTALVTNSRGLPVEGAVVTFSSELGTFDSNTAERTDENGEASKELRVTPGQIPANETSFDITVRTPSSSGGFLEETTTVRITRPSGS